MAEAILYFYGQLNDFLPRASRGVARHYMFERRVSIKDVVESLGVPHPEIEALIINGGSVDFDYIVQAGDTIEVYPPQLAAQVAHQPLRPPLPDPSRFVLDAHLGTLASYLRLLGFDTLYRNDYADDELARIADEETRILLTRDRGLMKRSRVVFAYFVRETEPRSQTIEVVKRYELRRSIQTMRRCIRCNGILQAVEKAAIIDQLAPKTRAFFEEFSMCETCGRIYWKGSHYQHMQHFVEDIFAATSSPGEIA